MATIDQTSRLAELIRLQFAAHSAATNKTKVSPKKPSGSGRKNTSSTGSKRASTKQSTTTLDGWLAQQIAALTPEDPQRQRKVFRLFLESVLAAEFGPQLIGDNGFDQLVEKVLLQMESDRELNTLMEEATLALIETPSA